jgi:hypothetical protein
MLSEEVKITQAITPAAGAAGSDEVLGATIDMQGFDAVMMVVTFGPIVTGAVTSIKAQEDSDPAMGTVADLDGTDQTVAEGDDNKTFVIDLGRPNKRYVRLAVERATQNATIGSATYYQYRARVRPPGHGTGVAVERWTAPAEAE